eukprot:4779959-Amphidinium_carterae.1
MYWLSVFNLSYGRPRKNRRILNSRHACPRSRNSATCGTELFASVSGAWGSQSYTTTQHFLKNIGKTGSNFCVGAK